jgi:hypothetical protein
MQQHPAPHGQLSGKQQQALLQQRAQEAQADADRLRAAAEARERRAALNRAAAAAGSAASSAKPQQQKQQQQQQQPAASAASKPKGFAKGFLICGTSANAPAAQQQQQQPSVPDWEAEAERRTEKERRKQQKAAKKAKAEQERLAKQQERLAKQQERLAKQQELHAHFATIKRLLDKGLGYDDGCSDVGDICQQLTHHLAKHPELQKQHLKANSSSSSSSSSGAVKSQYDVWLSEQRGASNLTFEVAAMLLLWKLIIGELYR